MPDSQAPSSFVSRRWWPWLLLLTVGLLIAWAMARSVLQKQAMQHALQQQTQSAAINVQIPQDAWMPLQLRTLQQGLPISGSLTAEHHAWVKARIPGEVTELSVREGDTVRKGQMLAKVDPAEAQARFQQAQLQAQAAQAQVAIEQRQFDNNQALVTRGFISATALESTASRLKAAQANYAAARAAQDALRKNLDDTVLYSPLDGQIAQRRVQLGERVNVDTPVLEVVDLRTLELEVALPSNDVWHVQPGQQALLSLTQSHTAQAAPSFTATVARISPAAQAGSRTLPAYLRLSQTSQTQLLRPGMYVQGFIELGQVQDLAVPLSAVFTDQSTPYVQVVRTGQVEHLGVTLGARSTPQSAVEGGEPQVWVAVQGQGLEAGLPVLLPQAGKIAAGTAATLAAHSPSASAEPQSQSVQP